MMHGKASAVLVPTEPSCRSTMLPGFTLVTTLLHITEAGGFAQSRGSTLQRVWIKPREAPTPRTLALVTPLGGRKRYGLGTPAASIARFVARSSRLIRALPRVVKSGWV